VCAVEDRSVEAKLDELRPTQVTVGYDEVAFKRRQWVERTDEEKRDFISKHRFPAVQGPNSCYYVVDGHHLGRALLEEGVGVVRLALIENMSHLDEIEFWRLMNRRRLIYPYDAQGRRREFAEMPKALSELTDDPFRSLAARVRRTGEYEKDSTPFAEFQWAEYFRNYITLPALRTYPERALECAKKLAREGSSTCGARFGGVLEHSSAARCPTLRNGVRLCDERHEGRSGAAVS
jgi:hypothetical protein